MSKATDWWFKWSHEISMNGLRLNQVESKGSFTYDSKLVKTRVDLWYSKSFERHKLICNNNHVVFS